MKKKLLGVLLASSVLLSFIGCGSGSGAASASGTSSAGGSNGGSASSAAEPLVLTYAEVNPEDTIVGQVAADFKSKVEELSGGSIVIDVQYSGVLGSEADVLDGMLAGSGAADISRISAFSLNSYGSEKSVLLSLPYTFESRDHFWNFAMSDLADEFLDEPYEKGIGVKGLFYGEEGFRHFFTRTPVSSISDFAGMKIRVSTDPVMTGLVEGLGAYSTVVAFGELYSSLQSGLVDGAEQPIANYKSNSFPEVANNLILDGHTLGAIEIVVASNVWDSLTEDQQSILLEAGRYAQEKNRENSQAKEDEVLAQLKAEGCNVVEVNDLAPWKEAVTDVVANNIKGQEDLYNQILAMK
ncbi:MAG: TRAP transporter substrate-binding protein [Lachnospiraceae bacterium]|nr:TRAP transporter substrate-binding protein [Lachnospiraceae bacterium]